MNVRLDKERLRKARKLRESGVVLSDLVREAIDKRFEQARGPRTRRDLEALMARIFEQYPDPPDLPRAEYDVYDSGCHSPQAPKASAMILVDTTSLRYISR